MSNLQKRTKRTKNTITTLIEKPYDSFFKQMGRIFGEEVCDTIKTQQKDYSKTLIRNQALDRVQSSMPSEETLNEFTRKSLGKESKISYLSERRVVE